LTNQINVPKLVVGYLEFVPYPLGGFIMWIFSLILFGLAAILLSIVLFIKVRKKYRNRAQRQADREFKKWQETPQGLLVAASFYLFAWQCLPLNRHQIPIAAAKVQRALDAGWKLEDLDLTPEECRKLKLRIPDQQTTATN